MTNADAVCVTLFAVWLLASAVGQIQLDCVQRWRPWDVLGLIPMWWFFAPTPPRGDFHLLIRDLLADGTTTGWVEVRVGGRRPWWGLLWNPRRRERKALFDIASSLVEHAQTMDGLTLQVSLPYLALLDYVSALPRTSASVATQFLLMSSDAIGADTEPFPVLTSAVHRLGDETRGDDE